MTKPAGQSCSNCISFNDASCKFNAPITKVVQGLWPVVGPDDWCAFWNVLPVSGAGGLINGPFPFFGDRGTAAAWARPGLSIGGSGNNFTSWLNQTPAGKATATATDNAGGFPLVVQSVQDAGGYCITAIMKSRAAAPWTLTVGMAAMSVVSSGLSNSYPLVLRNSVNDKAIALAWLAGAQESSTISSGGTIVQTWTAVSTGIGATRTIIAGANNIAYGFPFMDYFAFFRVVNDGTTLTFSISPEGVLFLPLKQIVTLADFVGTIDQIGFGIDRVNDSGVSDGASIGTAAILWNWVES